MAEKNKDIKKPNVDPDGEKLAKLCDELDRKVRAGVGGYRKPKGD